MNHSLNVHFKIISVGTDDQMDATFARLGFYVPLVARKYPFIVYIQYLVNQSTHDEIECFSHFNIVFQLTRLRSS